ncbi:protein EcsC [Paracoccus sp. S-4012]|uniref:EcsC family protein n=1 Tax=Paracoccus sp. S-4012 TaxID=2665648 RepID=UPI0012B0F59B|nr:EcsC family protein [Paracoccus sp. S-4012]MRX51965.1 protein EcsC [Paracoccus sp. S-4012]
MTVPAPRQDILPPITDPTVHAELDRLARAYVSAGGLAMELLSTVGGGAEGALRRLPGFVRGRLDRITLIGLERAIGAAAASRGVVRDRGDWFNRLASTTTGALGGAGGLAGAMIELPVTITMLMRAIMSIAAEHGFDPDDEDTRMEALRVFAAAGPLEGDDGTDLGLLAAKLSITGHSLQSLMAKVAPKLAASLGQKLAAQAVPLLGAFAGASINYAFTRYYQQVARVHFGLLRLRDESGLPKEALLEALRQRVEALQAKRAVKRV